MLCLVLLTSHLGGCAEFAPGGLDEIGNVDESAALEGQCPYLPVVCPEGFVSADPLSVRDSNSSAPAGEEGLAVQVIADASVEISTIGSSMDTVISVLADSCDGPMIACSDDFAGTQQSQVVVDVAAGELLVVVVAKMTGGSYELNLIEL